jgi:glyoxylase-like metal-dependent hydrolase (beta-lactamase superfamily II)
LVFFLHFFKSEIDIIDDVYQIKIDTPFQVKFVSLYLFKLDDQYILIDAGLNMGNWSKLFFTALDDIGISIEDISYCFITHLHMDHIGLVKTFKRKNPKLKIVMNDITHKILRWETSDSNTEELKTEAKKAASLMIKYGISEEEGKRIFQFFTMWPRLHRYRKPDVIVSDKDTFLKDLEIVWTPGHSFGHTCLFNAKKKYLFSGDHILSRITPHIGNFLIPKSLQDEYEKFNFDNILEHYLISLDRIDNLDAKIIFPAHQEIIYNPHERILEIKKHHENRLTEISKMIKEKPMTPHKISKIHFGSELDEINTFMALGEILGHLIYLENQGIIKKIEKNGQIFYSSLKVWRSS